ncbi:MAG: C45 family peptidase [Planctomycetota bacterium]
MIRTICAALLVLGSVLVAASLAFSPLLVRSSHPLWHDDSAQGGRLVVRAGLPLLELSGSPAERGRQQGALVGGVAHDLLGFMNLPTQLSIKRSRTFVDGCVGAIHAEDRDELVALAAASGISVDSLLRTHAIIETMCSAVVHTGPEGTRFGRNMDFPPADALGATTVLTVVREPGRHTYASVTWPGMIGVVSGMNDRGLATCILLNWHGKPAGPGEPLPLRARRILQECGDVDAALTLFSSEPLGSAHYLLIADPHRAVLAWRDASGLHCDMPTNGWLFVDNKSRAGGIATGERACALEAAAHALGHNAPDFPWYRRATTTSYMKFQNTQAMAFDCAAQRIELGRGTTLLPAALAPWVGIDLTALLGGAALNTAQVERLPAPTPMRHWRER